jgi:hypothetical protein
VRVTPGPDPDDGRPGEDAEAATTAGAEPEDDVAPPEAEVEVEPEWVRRRRLDAVFGDGAHGQALGDRYYRDQVPPHHG